MTYQETQSDAAAKTNSSKKSQQRKIGYLKKLDFETAKLFSHLKEKVNKKSYGRKIRDCEILSLAIRQINDDHIKQLQNSTMTEKDLLKIAHDDYQKLNGKISLDQFIGKLIRKEL